MCAYLRDFEIADRSIAAALKLTPDRPWIHVERAEILQQEDRFDEALEAALTAHELRPFYRPAVQAAAQKLETANRSQEALELLTAATEALGKRRHPRPVVRLAKRTGRRGRRAPQRGTARDLFPRLDKVHAWWLAARRCDIACLNDDLPAAVAAGREAGEGFFAEVVKNLEAATPEHRRVVLPVEFVQQHHVTCARRRLPQLASSGSSRPSIWTSPKPSVTTALRIIARGGGWKPMDSSPANSRSIGGRQWP